MTRQYTGDRLFSLPRKRPIRKLFWNQSGHALLWRAIPGLRVCPLSSIYWLVNKKLLIIEIGKRHNKMVDRIRYPTVSYLPFYYVFFQFLLLTIFYLQANILTTKDILSNLEGHGPYWGRQMAGARVAIFGSGGDSAAKQVDAPQHPPQGANSTTESDTNMQGMLGGCSLKGLAIAIGHAGDLNKRLNCEEERVEGEW